jgi:hypothetical protein
MFSSALNLVDDLFHILIVQPTIRVDVVWVHALYNIQVEDELSAYSPVEEIAGMRAGGASFDKDFFHFTISSEGKSFFQFILGESFGVAWRFRAIKTAILCFNGFLVYPR